MKKCRMCPNEHYNRQFCSRQCSAKFRQKQRTEDVGAKVYDLYVNKKRDIIEISDELKITTTSVYNHLKRLNVKTRPKYIDYTGKDYVYSKVIRCLSRGSRNRHARWLMKCNCGIEFECSSQPLGILTRYSCQVCKGKRHRCTIRLTKYIWNQIVYQAKSRNYDITIDREYAYQLFLDQDKKCALTGVNIKFAETTKGHIENKETTASLDRIDSTIGYHKGNVQWVHKELNIMKGALDQDYFIEICRKVINYSRRKKKNNQLSNGEI